MSKKEFKKDKGKKKFFKKNGNGKNNQRPQGEQELTDNMNGFLITCDRNREKNAIKEAYQIIEQHIEKIYPEISEKVDKLTEEFFQQKADDKTFHQLRNQQQELSQDQSDQKQFQYQKKKWIRESHIKMLSAFDTRVNCLIFIKVNSKTYPELDVDIISDSIMKSVHEDKERLSRCCYKFVPIRYVFQTDRETFKKHVKTLIDQNFTLERPIPWLLSFKARYTQKLQKSEVLTDINQLMEPLHYNDYRDPELVLVVEVNGAIMYMNILRNWNKFKEYSIKCDSKGDEDNQKINFQPKDKPKQQFEKIIGEDFQKPQFFEEDEVDLF